MTTNRSNNFKAAAKSILTIAALSVSLIASGLMLFPGTASAVDSATNPELKGDCGLDIGLVLDISGSIGNRDLQTMKDSFKNFVNDLLPYTPSQFSVTYFNTTANMVQGFTDDKSILTEAIQNKVPGSSQYTNWQDGLTKAESTLPNRSNLNLIIFASDGKPNRYNFDPVRGSGSNVDPDALEAAIIKANEIKNGGTRIITLGINDRTLQDNLVAISSADAYYNVDSFAALPGVLRSIIADSCGTTILECTTPGQTDPNPEACIDASKGVCGKGSRTCGANNFWNQCAYPAPGSRDCSSSLDNDCDGVADNQQSCGCTPTTPCSILGCDHTNSCGTYCGSCGGGGGGGGFYCGDHTCNYGESCTNCPTDCGACFNPPFCGDKICNNNEGCFTCPTDCGACSSSSGNNQTSENLYIFNEQVVTVSIGTDGATITWSTNKDSNSRLVYGAYNESHTYNSSFANYGYAKTTAEDSTQAISHSITIAGLDPATVYYVRAVSKLGSEATISGELSFTTKAVAGVETQTDNGDSGYSSTSQEEVKEETVGQTGGTEDSGAQNQVAAIGTMPIDPKILWIILIILGILGGGAWLFGRNK